MAQPKDAATQQAPTEAQLRELVLRTEQVRQQVAALEGQRDYLDELLADARRAHGTLKHLASAKPGDEILIPVGAGAFVHATLAQPDRAIASLGSSLHAEVPSEEAARRLGDRVESLEAAQAALAKDLDRLSDELARASAILETYYGG